jgi:hypothetical protein
MSKEIALILIGSVIALVSSLATIIIQHILDIKKMVAERRHEPFRIVYGKQIEFFDAAVPILGELNSYITTIDVWLGERSKEAPTKVKEAVGNNQAVTQFYYLIEKYFMYLPKKLLEEANHLYSECMILSSQPNMNKTNECIKLKKIQKIEMFSHHDT